MKPVNKETFNAEEFSKGNSIMLCPSQADVADFFQAVVASEGLYWETIPNGSDVYGLRFIIDTDMKTVDITREDVDDKDKHLLYWTQNKLNYSNAKAKPESELCLNN
jgi:hypothetical protein